MWQGIVSLFYPRLCVLCNGNLLSAEEHFCTTCQMDMPITNFHLQQGNELEKMFWGRVKIERAFSFMYFKKGGMVQKMLYQLKYKGNIELAQYLGMLYGTSLHQIIAEQNIHAVIAIPLHKSKQKKRGYNQSKLFADGLCYTLQIENFSKHVSRVVATETQTKKGRFDRWQNVESIFNVSNIAALENRHVLLVDDVITTGATIEACAIELLKINGCKVSVASIAVAIR